mmetsp:Transcript_8505/g.24396  ORF Transcript_8505/g.24396 Transcript_8505/m.24396 type:complete len:196 (-) Transcript_8505:38-625(-)
MLLSAAYTRLLGAPAVAASAAGAEAMSVEAPSPSGNASQASLAAAAALACDWHKLGARRFRCVLRHGDVEMEAYVEVALDYPLRPPSFSLTRMQWPATQDGSRRGATVRLPAAELAALEAQVNIWSANVVAEESPEPRALLASQVAALMTAFDVYALQALSQRLLLQAGQPPLPVASRGRELRRASLGAGSPLCQ